MAGGSFVVPLRFSNQVRVTAESVRVFVQVRVLFVTAGAGISNV
jgi:hypothetical protein